MKITVVLVSVTVLLGVCLLQGTRTLGVFVQKGPGVKVHMGPRGVFCFPCSQGDAGTVVLEPAWQHPTV